MLGFLPTYSEKIDLKYDWDDPHNEQAFKEFVPQFLNPDIGEIRDSRGFALSHFAGNVRIFGRGRPMKLGDVTDGISTTIMVGECATDFKAWGDPANLRDPADGINRVRDGFGGPKAMGAHFAMVDGSVKFISSEIDPRSCGAGHARRQ